MNTWMNIIPENNKENRIYRQNYSCGKNRDAISLKDGISVFRLILIKRPIKSQNRF